jgi:hypothetical protein
MALRTIIVCRAAGFACVVYLANQDFVGEGSISIRGIEQGNTQLLYGIKNELHHLFFRPCRSIERKTSPYNPIPSGKPPDLENPTNQQALNKSNGLNLASGSMQVQDCAQPKNYF